MSRVKKGQRAQLAAPVAATVAVKYPRSRAAALRVIRSFGRDSVEVREAVVHEDERRLSNKSAERENRERIAWNATHKRQKKLLPLDHTAPTALSAAMYHLSGKELTVLSASL